MKKYIFLPLFSFFSLFNYCHDLSENRIALITTIQREAENFIWHDAKLTNEQLQLLLNLCSASYAIVVAETKLMQEAQYIYPMTWHLRYNNDDETFVNAEHIVTLEQSLVRFLNLFKARKILHSAHQELMEKLTQPEHQPVYSIIEHMAKHCTHLISYCANQEHTAIEDTLGESKNILANSSSMLHLASNTIKTLEEGTFTLINQTSTTKSLETIKTAQKLMPNLAKNIYETMQATDLITNKINDFQEFGALPFYIYYKVTFDGMKERGVDDQYFAMLFENNTVISTDPKTRKFKEPIFDTNIPFFNH